MTFCGVLRLSQVTSITLVCIGLVSVGPIGLGPTQQEHRSGWVGQSFQFHQWVPVRSESKRQLVWFGRSKLVNLGPTGLDQDRTETEVEYPGLVYELEPFHVAITYSTYSSFCSAALGFLGRVIREK